MKKILSAFLLLISTHLFSQHSLEKVWQSDSVMLTPESVLIAPANNLLYVSNMGDAQKENTGFISKLDLNGKIIQREWITGLNGNKGLGVYNGLLYAAELHSVAIIDIAKGTIKEHLPVEGAQMLNDITIDSKGIVYVSDTRSGKIHKIENGKPTVFLENLNNPNGLLSVGTDLYFLGGGSLQKVDAKKQTTVLASGMEGNVDGIQMISPTEFLVSSWQGVLYCVKSDGSKQVLIDTRPQKLNTADFAFDVKKQLIYLPTFAGNTVVAYKLK